MDAEAIVELIQRMDRLEQKLNAIADHLKINLMYTPPKYECMTDEQMQKTMAMPTSSGR
jgi:hypothetical protein